MQFPELTNRNFTKLNLSDSLNQLRQQYLHTQHRYRFNDISLKKIYAL